MVLNSQYCKLCFTQGFSGLVPGTVPSSSSCESALWDEEWGRGSGSSHPEPQSLALVPFLHHAVFRIFPIIEVVGV